MFTREKALTIDYAIMTKRLILFPIFFLPRFQSRRNHRRISGKISLLFRLDARFHRRVFEPPYIRWRGWLENRGVEQGD